ncbi:hypothetical protein PM082_024077 [Marasmius tenuissimus]|nr:hypothetical protein PM082_024077 [Marasmius tenuissimus]
MSDYSFVSIEGVGTTIIDSLIEEVDLRLEIEFIRAAGMLIFAATTGFPDSHKLEVANDVLRGSG